MNVQGAAFANATDRERIHLVNTGRQLDIAHGNLSACHAHRHSGWVEAREIYHQRVGPFRQRERVASAAFGRGAKRSAFDRDKRARQQITGGLVGN